MNSDGSEGQRNPMLLGGFHHFNASKTTREDVVGRLSADVEVWNSDLPNLGALPLL